MGNKFTELFHPDDFKQLVKHMQIVSKDTEDNTHILEYRFKHKNGQWRWCLSYDTPFQRKVNGDVEKMIGSFIDITERKQAEELLLKNKNRLEYALNSIKTGAWELDLETMGSWRMFKHDQIFGHNEPLDEWTYDMFLEHVIPEDREIVNQKFQHAIATKTDWNFECRIKRNNDGKIVGYGPMEIKNPMEIRSLEKCLVLFKTLLKKAGREYAKRDVHKALCNDRKYQ